MLLIGLGMAWLAGLVPVAAWGAPWWMGSTWVALVGAIFAVRRRGPVLAMTAAAALAAMAGWRMEGALPVGAPPLEELMGRNVTAVGVVVSEPSRRELSTAYTIRLERVEAGDAVLERPGTIRAWLHQYAQYLPGDRLELRGKLEAAPVFDTFDYRAYLGRQGITATMRGPRVTLLEEGGVSAGRALVQVRLALDRAIQRALPEPESTLAAGIAFGRDDGFSEEMKEAFNASGLRHLVAVSGSNLVLVAALTMAVAVRGLGRHRAWPIAAAAVVGYVLLAGFEPSVVRAAIMVGVLFAGEVVGRPQSGLPALALALIAMTAVHPGAALDAGFQLSASATAGLLTFAPWLRTAFAAARRWWVASWLPTWATDVAALSLAATIATAPITWAHFGRISLVGVGANVIAQPVTAIAFWCSLGTAGLGLVSPDVAALATRVTWYPLAFIVAIARESAALPGASVGTPPASTTVTVAIVAIMALAAWPAYRWLPPGSSLPDDARRRATIGNRLALAGAVTALLGWAWIGSASRTGGLTVDVLDVGQGDAILITTPGGRQVLIDGGPSGLRLARELGAVMPPQDRHIDALVISHPQEDHVGGIPELAERMTIGRAVTNGDRNPSLTGRLTHDRLAGRVAVGAAGDWFEVDGVRFELLWPPADLADADLNDRSLVLLVTYADVRLLFTGDIEATAQRQLLATGMEPVHILKVPHHGSRTSDWEFLGLAEGGIATISVGAGNTYGHPHPTTLEALAGATVLRTDQHGRIRVVVRAGVVSVRTAR